MNSKAWDVAVIGAGPAGLAAAWAAGRYRCTVLVVDENAQAGGQLRKQTHRFFGGSSQQAGTRGFVLARRWGYWAKQAGAAWALGYTANGLEGNGEGFRLHIAGAEQGRLVHARKVIVATGAQEKPLAFPGWTLPGVMGAGAAQTMMNLHRVRPGRRAVIVGGGNVGLIVGLQLLQAGVEVAGLVEQASRLGGYAVHASRLRRAGVPVLTGQRVLRAAGKLQVEAVEIGSGGAYASKRWLDTDLILLAVGMTPLNDLARLAGADGQRDPALGGWVPLAQPGLETSVPGLRVAGDASGVEEASVALEEGRLAGLLSAKALGQPVPPAEISRSDRELRALRGQGRPGG